MTSLVPLPELHHSRHQRGLSLVELMISMVISLILLLGLTTLLVQQSQTRDELDKSSRQIENGRYAMQMLHDDIQHAGFYGQYSRLPDPPAALPDPCLTDTTSLLAAMPLAIQGYNSPAASPLACINNANFLPFTDILVIRRAATNSIPFDTAIPPVTTTMLQRGLVYLQTSNADIRMAVGTGWGGNIIRYPVVYDPPPGPGQIHAPLRPYLVRIYFISPCTVPADGGNNCTGAADDNGRPVPTLKRMDLTAVGGVTTFALTPLVEGIENMQLDYGVDGDKNMLAPAPTIDGSPDVYCSDPDLPGTKCPALNSVHSLPALSPSNPTNWAHVMTVSVNLLARNNDPTTGWTDTGTYVLGNNPGVTAPPAALNYKRHVFSELVRVVNPSGRRANQ